jgi:hypothetical protein
MEFEQVVFALSLRVSRDEACRSDIALSELLSKLVRLNRVDFLFRSCIPTIWKHCEGHSSVEYLQLWQAILGNVSDLDRTIESLLRAIDGRVLSKDASTFVVNEISRKLLVPVLQHPDRGLDTFDTMLGRKFLLQRTFSIPLLRLILTSLNFYHANAPKQSDEEQPWQVRTMELLLKTWTSREWISKVGDHQHECEWASVLLCFMRSFS